MQLPVGIDDFGDIIERKLDFVDKSLFIKAILDDMGTGAAVITRPRRFGKTLNLSMLQYFLSPDVNGQPTKGMFNSLKIAQYPECMKHQGQHPVVLISLKSVKDHSFESARKSLWVLIRTIYAEHRYLLTSDKIPEDDKRIFTSILNLEENDDAILKVSLKYLTQYLYLYHGVKPYLLIDEYDSPIQESYLHGYYDQMINLMRGLLGETLKTNPYLEKGVITGIFRISKESLFSGINNLKVYSMLNNQFGEYFGFTESEVDALLQKARLTDKSAEIKHWYNGYLMGDTTIYNPWSLVSCLMAQGKLQTYWVNTSNNNLIKKLFARAGISIKTKLEQLICNKSIEALIDENMIFGELDNKVDALWSLLLFSGYLKVEATQLAGSRQLCQLQVPNYEVMLLYRDVISEWFIDFMGYDDYQKLIKDLISGNITTFEKTLQRYLSQSMSYFDVTGTQPEKFYHGFVMGLLVNLERTHTVKSNRESGDGRYDVMIIPNDKNILGIIIEFKTVEQTEDLETVAKSALAQIAAKQYATEMKQSGINHILKLGMAFKGKQLKILSAME